MIMSFCSLKYLYGLYSQSSFPQILPQLERSTDPIQLTDKSQTEKHSTKLPGEQYLVTFDIFYSVFNFKIISAIIYCNLRLINACCMAQEGAGNLMSLFSLKNCQQSSLLVLIKKIGMFFKSLRFDSETFKIANSL